MVTIADIKAFGMNHFKSLLTGIEVQKGTKKEVSLKGGFSRTTHIVKDKMTGRVRLLTAAEAERIQGFPTDHTKYCLVKGETVEMPLRKRRFMMGNALVVNLVADMEKTLDKIFDQE